MDLDLYITDQVPCVGFAFVKRDIIEYRLHCCTAVSQIALNAPGTRSKESRTVVKITAVNTVAVFNH